MKLGGIKKENLLIELDEKELSIIIEGLEAVGSLEIISDIDSIVFNYYKKLEDMANMEL